MRSTLKQLSNHIVIDKIEDTESNIRVSCHLNNRSVICPKCNKKITSVHSIHTRKIQDLPVQNKTVFLVLQVRHFNCRHCKNIFTEELTFAAKTAHKTNRLLNYILDISCSNSSITSQGALNLQGVKVGKSAICTYQKKR